MDFVVLQRAASLEIKGPVTRKTYHFTRGVKTPVDPRDSAYFLSQPDRFKVWSGDVQKSSSMHEDKAIARKTVKELIGVQGPSIPPLQAAGDLRMKVLRDNAEFRAQMLTARVQQALAGKPTVPGEGL